MMQKPSPQSPIGVFDSGLGGLTAVKELHAILPGEDIVYFGDTARVPYGVKGRDTIITYAKQDIAFLLSQKVKTILAACGTVSSTLPQQQGDALPVPYMGVVQAAVAAALAATQSGRIGVIATEATIASGSYNTLLQQQRPGVFTFSAACPLFVPLVENGRFAQNDPMAVLAVEEYLAPVKAAGVDTLIMGCTHYPLLTEAIAAYLGGGVTLIDSGRAAALALRARLDEEGLLTRTRRMGTVRYYVTDDPARFGALARIFLGSENGWQVQQINIEDYCL